MLLMKALAQGFHLPYELALGYEYARNGSRYSASDATNPMNRGSKRDELMQFYNAKLTNYETNDASHNCSMT